MIWLHCFLAVMLFTASAKPDLVEAVLKEVQSVADPIVKVVAKVGDGPFCEKVKRVLMVDYNSYSEGEPDLSKLTLNFITNGSMVIYNRAINITYKLTDAAELIPKSQWFNPNKPLKIYCHGFTDDPSKASYKSISTAFLMDGDYNILALDASSLIRWMYPRSTTMVHFIGNELGKTCAAMVNAGMDPSNIHIIGHGLGSHIAGFAGKTFYNRTGSQMGRITGLDPAGPCFDVNETLRLNSTDAAFVDVIHTDAGVFGIDEQVGDVDFYPNSGSQQPNCVLQTCSHSFAWHLFADSVVHKESLLAISCPDWASFRSGTCDRNDTSLMGYACSVNTRGKYYLQTNGEPIYGRYENGTYNNAGIVTNIEYTLGDVVGNK